MILEVKREFIPIGAAGSQWEQRSYSQVVWKHDGVGQVLVFRSTTPHDYVEGLLTPYIDGSKVALPIFDAALHMITMSRLDIEKQLSTATE